MNKTSALISAADTLRRRAEAQLGVQRNGRQAKTGDQTTKADILRMIQELEVLMIELEMQDLELQETRDGLTVALEKHKQLYDLAPMGYVSTNELGDIVGMNMTGAGLLGIVQSRLINRRLLLLMSPTSRPIFSAFMKRTFMGSSNQTCEVMLLKEGGGTFWADFWSASGVPPRGKRKRCLFTFRDITARKLAAQLTSRELEVLRFIVGGKPNKHSAAELGISQRTVEKHRGHLMKKLDVHDIAGLTRFAIGAGIIDVIHG